MQQIGGSGSGGSASGGGGAGPGIPKHRRNISSPDHVPSITEGQEPGENSNEIRLRIWF